MKITNLIVPIMVLTTITNANKQELLQKEKMPAVSYEVLVRDNWDNYLTNANLTENAEYSQWDKNKDKIITEITIIPQSEFKNILANNGKKPPIHQLSGCDDLFRSIMNTCDGLYGGKKKACSYWICMMGGG